MIQEKEAALTNSVYFISLLRVVALLKGPSEAPRRISRYLAAGGWMTIFVITAALQFFLMVLILETSTSNTCDPHPHPHLLPSPNPHPHLTLTLTLILILTPT